MAYKALDIARYIVNYSNEKQYGISNLKLQKLLYFIQADFLSYYKNRQPCFDEDIEAWSFGPVIPCVYHQFKQYGSGNIPTISEYFEVTDTWDVVKVSYNENIISKDDRNRIARIVDGLSEYSATSLVDITHNQAPWKNVFESGKNHPISQKSIQEYFN